jgi:hypothetical protein
VHLSLFENTLWILGTTLKVLLCALVFYRALYRRLPLFAVYVSLLVAEAILIRWTYHHWGYSSRVALYVYWCDLGVILLARGFVVAELCWTSLRDYPAVWSLVGWLLIVISVGLLVYAGVTASKNSSPTITFLLTAERGLELSVAVLLVALLAFGVRYHVWLGAVERNITLGLAIYSTFQMVNNTFMNDWMVRYFHWWVSVRVISFDLAMIIWIIPLLRPVPSRPSSPTVISEETSLLLLRRLLERMRDLTEDLKSAGRESWK